MPPKRTLRPRTPQLGSLGQAIEEARKKAELSQEDLAERSGVHPTHISGLERGARNPTYKTLLQVAEGLGTTLGELATAADNYYKKKRSSSTKRG
jgi:transcriptional regulator with XRE-family HTH domain